MKSLLLFLMLVPMSSLVGCESQGSNDASQAVQGAFETKSTTGEIALDLTPHYDDGELVVDVQATTHSGDLNELDLDSLFTLRSGEQVHRATKANKLSGHHGKGSVSFALAERPRTFTLEVAAMREVREQSVQWP